LLQVTNVVDGAFDPAPSPDGAQLALVTYSARGYDLARMALLPASWKRVDQAPAADARPPVSELPPEEVYPVRAYEAWPTLRPHFWLPYAATDAGGSTLGALTGGYDAIGRHEYAATAWFGLGSHMPGWDIAYINRSFYPELTFATSRSLNDATSIDGRHLYTERALSGSLTAVFPFSQVERSQSFTADYSATNLAVNQNPDGAAVREGLLSAATLQYTYSDAHSFINSISREQGQRFTLTLRVSDPAIGSAFRFQQLSSSYSHYFAMPWTHDGRPLHHALAVRLSGGLARGDLSERHYFYLGGFDLGSPVTAVLNPANAPSRILRGFVHDAFRGEAYELGTAEYRFPILDIEAGAWTLPVFLRRLHGAVYSDVGDAFTPGNHDYKLHAGAGAELRAEVVLGYILPTDLRLGCARGLEDSRLAIIDCYAALGGEF
jgi:hypothetical protein